MPCQKILALIRSTQPTKADTLNNGVKLTTAGIEDLLASVGAQHAPVGPYTITAICNMENLLAFRLDPARRGGVQNALVTLSVKMGETFVVDQVQLHSPEQAVQARTSLRSMLRVASLLHSPSRKRCGTWTNKFSPASAKKCRVLGRSATVDSVH